MGQTGLLALLNSPYLTRLSGPHFWFNGSDALVEVLASTPGLLRLRSLSLYSGTLSTQALERLLCALEKGQLTELYLDRSILGDAGARLLASWPPGARLTSLLLLGWGIGDAGAQALADSPYLATLRLLRILHNPLGPVGTEALRQRFGERVWFGW